MHSPPYLKKHHQLINRNGGGNSPQPPIHTNENEDIEDVMESALFD